MFLLDVIPITTPAADPVLEQIWGPGGGFRISSLGQIVGAGAVWALVGAGAAMFICVVWSGVQWMTSGDDKGSMQKARTRLNNCLIGLSIVALAWAVMMLIQFFFGINILRA